MGEGRTPFGFPSSPSSFDFTQDDGSTVLTITLSKVEWVRVNAQGTQGPAQREEFGWLRSLLRWGEGGSLFVDFGVTVSEGEAVAFGMAGRAGDLAGAAAGGVAGMGGLEDEDGKFRLRNFA